MDVRKLINVNNYTNIKLKKEMKKIFIAAATVMALAGCSQTELDHTPAGQKEIKFSNLNDKLTRSANDGNDDYKV